MSKNVQAGHTIAKVIGYVLLVLVIVGVVGVIAYFTGGFTSDFKTFYVTVDGKDVLASAGGYKISQEAPLTIDVKYTFGSAGGDVSGYSVKVVPHAIEGKDFDFTLDDQVYSFQAETDLTAGFDITREETSFSIAPKTENGSVADVLQAVYPNNTIGGCEDKGYEDMYALIVTSYNSEASVTLYFSVLQDAAGVTLDQEVIVF